MEWRLSSSSFMPKMVDMTSYEKYVYVRRNVKKRESEEGTMFYYEECLIPREDYELIVNSTFYAMEELATGIEETYEETINNSSSIDDLEIALEEVYEMIAESEVV